MRHCGVAGMTGDREEDAIAGGHDRAIVYGDGSRLKARPIVIGENALHRKTLE
jgi:hypothetical protein